MPHYMIMFNDEWVREHTDAELVDKAAASRRVLAEMRSAGVLVYSNGGTDRASAVGHVRAEAGQAAVAEGVYVERDEYFGGLCVVDVPDDDTALEWAGRIAIAVDWPQEVHRFRGAGHTA